MKSKPTPSQPATSSGRLRRLFQRSIEQRSTLAATAEEQGVAASVLWRAAHEAQYQPLDRALEALELVGLPPAAFFAELAREESAAAGGAPPPVVWLRFYRDKSPKDPFVLEIEPALQELLAIPLASVEPGPGEAGRRAELRMLEELRPKDALGARGALEGKIRAWLAPAAELAPAELVPAELVPTPALLADLATALAIRSSILRQRGQNGAASDGLQAAYPLARRAGDNWALGWWHQKAPWLLFDAKRSDLALELLEPALRFYFAAGAFEEASQLFVDRAILYNDLGRVAEAKTEYGLALERLSPASWRHRLAAHLNLAQIHQHEGRLEMGLRELELAARESREQDLAYAFLRRRGGEILCALDRPALAVPLFEESLQLFTALGDGEDVVLVALQLAEALLRAGERRKAHALARDIGALLGRRRDDAAMKAAREAFDDLAALAELGRLTEREVAEVRSRFEAGPASPRRPVRRATGPEEAAVGGAGGGCRLAPAALLLATRHVDAAAFLVVATFAEAARHVDAAAFALGFATFAEAARNVDRAAFVALAGRLETAAATAGAEPARHVDAAPFGGVAARRFAARHVDAAAFVEAADGIEAAGVAEAARHVDAAPFAGVAGKENHKGFPDLFPDRGGKTLGGRDGGREDDQQGENDQTAMNAGHELRLSGQRSTVSAKCRRRLSLFPKR